MYFDLLCLNMSSIFECRPNATQHQDCSQLLVCLSCLHISFETDVGEQDGVRVQEANMKPGVDLFFERLHFCLQ